MKRLCTLFLCFTLLLGCFPNTVYGAPDWPNNVSTLAEGSIVMEVESGTVLFGKNLHTTYFPASITKILTALIVLENCEMDEIVTFSHNAVYNVESGSSNAGLDEGDQLTVKDTLYALMLKSANEAANALAEHVGGSIDGFSVMMNEKAESLGCVDSNFANPSGLNNPDHYTSAYDMGLIACAAAQNEDFVEIASTTYYDLPVTKINVDGLRIYPGHKMLKKNLDEYYYPGIIWGKTGYTSLAGNTLVTCAERDGMMLVTVVLNGQQTHYVDTKALLDFGFSNFKQLTIADYDTTYTSIENDMTISGLSSANLDRLNLEEDRYIVVPNDAEFTDAVSSISYDLPATAPEGAIAQINYTYNDRKIGSTYLVLDPEEIVIPTVAELPTIEEEVTTVPEELASTEAVIEEETSTGFVIPQIVINIAILILLLAIIGGGIFYLKMTLEKKEEAERIARYEKRQQRLKDIGMSESEFSLLMQEKRSNKTKKD